MRFWSVKPVRWKPTPLESSGGRAIVAGMFLRTHHRRKYGKDHYYFSVVENRRVAGGKKAPKTGRMTPAQLLVEGSITHVQESTTGGSGGISFRGINLGGSKDHAEINVTINLVDSTTGQVKASTKVGFNVYRKK